MAKPRFKLSTHQQGTPEWFAERAGCITGSNARCVVAEGKTKGTEATTRRNYRYQLALEIITGKEQPQFDLSWNAHIKRGKELEDLMRQRYTDYTGLAASTAGFARMSAAMAGCSVDGVVKDGERTGLLEGKCPIPAVHTGYLEGEKLPSEYATQVIHNLWVTGYDFADFVSFNEEMPPGLDVFVLRVERNDLQAEVAEYEAKAMVFISEVLELVQKLNRLAASRRHLKPLATTSVAAKFDNLDN